MRRQRLGWALGGAGRSSTIIDGFQGISSIQNVLFKQGCMSRDVI
jgi:hypothetical protein